MRATKALAVARKRGDSNLVRTCLRTQSTTELNQKLTKHSQKTFDTGRLHGGKYLCKNLRVKEGEGGLLEGGVFSGTYGTIIMNEVTGAEDGKLQSYLEWPHLHVVCPYGMLAWSVQ